MSKQSARSLYKHWHNFPHENQGVCDIPAPVPESSLKVLGTIHRLDYISDKDVEEKGEKEEEIYYYHYYEDKEPQKLAKDKKGNYHILGKVNVRTTGKKVSVGLDRFTGKQSYKIPKPVKGVAKLGKLGMIEFIDDKGKHKVKKFRGKMLVAHPDGKHLYIAKVIKKNPAKLQAQFQEIKEIVSKKYPLLSQVILKHDRFMDNFHKHMPEVYAGSNPDPNSYEIIYAKALEDEPIKYQRGILWHEFGHQIQIHYLGEPPADDMEANRIIEEDFGIELGYENYAIGINPTTEQFMRAIAGEGWAIGDYREMLQGAKTPQERQMIQHIINEEQEHLYELLKMKGCEMNPSLREGYANLRKFTYEKWVRLYSKFLGEPGHGDLTGEGLHRPDKLRNIANHCRMMAEAQYDPYYIAATVIKRIVGEPMSAERRELIFADGNRRMSLYYASAILEHFGKVIDINSPESIKFKEKVRFMNLTDIEKWLRHHAIASKTPDSTKRLRTRFDISSNQTSYSSSVMDSRYATPDINTLSNPEWHTEIVKPWDVKKHIRKWTKQGYELLKEEPVEGGNVKVTMIWREPSKVWRRNMTPKGETVYRTCFKCRRSGYFPVYSDRMARHIECTFCGRSWTERRMIKKKRPIAL